MTLSISMELLFDHTHGKQENQDIVICRPMAIIDEDEETEVLEKGWLGRLELHGPKGALHIYAVYLDPGSWKKRNQQMQKLVEVCDPNAHNLVLGDRLQFHYV